MEETDIFDAIRAGKLQYRVNYAHGNPYFRLLRQEVIALAKGIQGESVLELKTIEYEIKKTTTEINSYKRKILALEKKKQALVQRRSDLANPR